MQETGKENAKQDRKNNKKISTFFNIYSSRITNDVTYEYI